MKMTLDEIAVIKNEYVQDYYNKEDYKGYINGVGISNLKLSVGKEEISLKEGETLDDLCLDVYLIKKLPEGLTMPSEYKSIRVFYTLISEIKKH